MVMGFLVTKMYEIFIDQFVFFAFDFKPENMVYNIKRENYPFLVGRNFISYLFKLKL